VSGLGDEPFRVDEPEAGARSGRPRYLQGVEGVDVAVHEHRPAGVEGGLPRRGTADGQVHDRFRARPGKVFPRGGDEARQPSGRFRAAGQPAVAVLDLAPSPGCGAGQRVSLPHLEDGRRAVAAAGRTLVRRYALALTPAGAGNEAAVTATAVPPLNGGPGTHGSEAAHAVTIAGNARVN
jgi:hypothetical protein